MKNSLKRWIVILFTLTFNFFFWQETFGINLILFTAIFGSLLALLFPDQRKKKQTYLGVIGIIITSIAVLYHNSLFSKIMMFASIFLYVASLVETELKTIYYLIPSGFLGMITSPFRKNDFYSSPTNQVSGKSVKWIKLLLIPSSILILFVIIYSIANPVFSNKLNLIIDNLGDYLSHIFEYYPFSRFLFIGLGLLFGIGVFYYKSLDIFNEREAKHIPNLKRKRYHINRIISMMALKSERNGAIITIIMLNVLLFMINLIDFNVFIIQDSISITDSFSDNLHKGTWMLIFSIFLSAAIVLYIFRGNLNFYSKNKLLKSITYIWIVQNIVLCFSVFARVYHYINHHGLAYKRIGVIIFVTATILGLLTLIVKVKNKKTVSYLFKLNGISIFSILIISSFFNWDVIIAKHNFENAKTKNIDYIFELNMSDKVLPILDQHRSLLEANNKKYLSYRFSFDWISSQTLIERLDQRIENFKNSQAKKSWLSWNYADDKTQKYFIEK